MITVQCPVIEKREIEGGQSDLLVTFSSEQGITLNDPNKVVQGASEDNTCMQVKLWFLRCPHRTFLKNLK